MADTRHLSLEEHGAYLSLMMIAWRTSECTLPDDDKRLAMMLGVTPRKWAKLKPVVMAFWTLKDGQWSQSRLQKERTFVAKKSKQNREAANTRWNAKSLKNNNADNAKAPPMQCERNAPPPPPTYSEDKSSAPRDLKTVIFEDGLAFLKTKGLSEQRARPMLGRWVGKYGEAAVISAVSAAQNANVLDPIPYVERILRNSAVQTGGYEGMPC